MIDQTIDETVSLTDSTSLDSNVSREGNDTLSMDADLVSLAMSYQLALVEALSVLDDVETETFSGAFAADNVTVTDSLLTATSYDRVLSTESLASSDTIVVGLLADRADSNAVAVSDSIAAGLWHDVSVSDTMVVTELWLAATEYQRSGQDTVALTDTIHTWMALNGVLQVDLEGEAALRAVLMKRKAASMVEVIPPPRVVMLPKTPPELTPHYVVNPNPPGRNDR
jgi:hypothetical protein